MERIRILSGRVEITDREGRASQLPLSVVEFNCSNEDAAGITGLPEISRLLKVKNLKIFPFTEEIAGTIQIDAPVRVNLSEMNVYIGN